MLIATCTCIFTQYVHVSTGHEVSQRSTAHAQGSQGDTLLYTDWLHVLVLHLPPSTCTGMHFVVVILTCWHWAILTPWPRPTWSIACCMWTVQKQGINIYDSVSFSSFHIWSQLYTLQNDYYALKIGLLVCLTELCGHWMFELFIHFNTSFITFLLLQEVEK